MLRDLGQYAEAKEQYSKALEIEEKAQRKTAKGIPGLIDTLVAEFEIVKKKFRAS